MITILPGDNREVLKTLPAESFHAVVTDPPYELGFMGKHWDGTGIAYDPVLWAEVLRVLKPGGWLLSFGGSRTYHRMACAIEDAGFEIRDMIEWIYGSGFPKSMDVSKAMDKAAGAERTRGKLRGRIGQNKTRCEQGYRPNEVAPSYDSGPPITDDYKLWNGWGTALKPAHEPICLARKPMGEATVAANVLKHGTGALNIDAGRIAGPERGLSQSAACGIEQDIRTSNDSSRCDMLRVEITRAPGRFPANLILDPAAAALLDAQSGDNCGAAAPVRRGHSGVSNGIYRDFAGKGDDGETFRGDTGGASRFFYTAKASGSDRGNHVKGDLPLFGVDEEKFRNTHPTVKPLALMTYLLKLVCPPGAHVLDPFLGSGTTAVACQRLGVDCTGIELQEEYLTIIRERLKI